MPTDVDLPLPQGTSFTSDATPPLFHPESYHSLLGKILYLKFTQLDLSHDVHNLSQFVWSPCTLHWEGDLHILRYLKGTLHHNLFYSSSSGSNLITYSNTD